MTIINSKKNILNWKYQYNEVIKNNDLNEIAILIEQAKKY